MKLKLHQGMVEIFLSGFIPRGLHLSGCIPSAYLTQYLAIFSTYSKNILGPTFRLQKFKYNLSNVIYLGNNNDGFDHSSF